MAAVLQDEPAPVWALHRPQILQEISTPSSVQSSTDCSVDTYSPMVSSPQAAGESLLWHLQHPGAHRAFSHFFPHSLVLFYPFLHMLSQSCPTHGWGAQLCPAVGLLEPATSGTGQSQPLLIEAAPPPPVANTLPQTSNIKANICVYHSITVSIQDKLFDLTAFFLKEKNKRPNQQPYTSSLQKKKQHAKLNKQKTSCHWKDEVSITVSGKHIFCLDPIGWPFGKTSNSKLWILLQHFL